MLWARHPVSGRAASPTNTHPIVTPAVAGVTLRTGTSSTPSRKRGIGAGIDADHSPITRIGVDQPRMSRTVRG